METKKFDVSAFGEALIDFTQSGLNEDGVVMFAQNPGGAPGNVCVAINRLGGKSAFLGKVGTDMHGEFLKKTLADEGVNVTGLVMDPDVFTTLAFVSLNENNERSFSFARKTGADTRMKEDDLDLDTITASKIFHVGSLSLTDEPSRSATYAAVRAAREAGVLVSYDPNYRSTLWSSEEAAKEMMRTLISGADLMKISDEETALLTSHADPKEAAEFLLDQGVSLAAVTLGANGALLATKNAQVIVPGFKTEVADTTGAGDSFWGTLLLQVAQSGRNPGDLTEEELAAMGRRANAVASLTVSKKGAIPALPTAETVEEFLAAQKS